MASTHDGKPNPGQRILELMMGSWASQAVGTLARLRVFDAVARGAASADAVAAELDLAPDALFRVMRAGAMLGVLEPRGERSFALTAAGELLRSDVPGSMRALLDAETAPGHWLPWAKLDGCVRAGRSLATETLGKDIWSHYAEHAEEGRAFSEGMSGLSAMALGAIGAAWQPPRASRVVDIGGAHGAFLRWVLERLPEARGVLFDLPHVIGSARGADGAAALGERVECVAGDFARGVPEGGDLYLLKHILHDWDDATARTVLRHVRSAMKPDATVVVVEMLVPEDGSPSPALLLDLNMLVMLPGRERTAGEMRALFADAGLELTRVTATPSPFAVLEAKAR
ncbi:MAG TPA: methyltransferase [Polyangiaceae bacterium]|nr:methyltransferase [Polyangiaceae bacterium]